MIFFNLVLDCSTISHNYFFVKIKKNNVTSIQITCLKCRANFILFVIKLYLLM
jgi:hypothetical protein